VKLAFKNIIIPAFILILGFFFFNQQFHFLKDADYRENRQKAARPALDFRKLDAYPSAYEKYFTDHFSTRGYFLRYMSRLKFSLWNKSPKPDLVILGKENWLYNVDKELDEYNGKRNLDEAQLKLVLNEFLYRKEVLDSMGIDMVIGILPTKYTIYPEFLPDLLYISGRQNAAAGLISYIENNSDFQIFYPLELLDSLKRNSRVYYKNDNHWNDIGAYHVARALSGFISDTIPEIPLADFCFDTITRYGNLAYMSGNAELFPEQAVMLSKCKNDAVPFKKNQYPPIAYFAYPDEYHLGFTTHNPSLPDALFIRDSYTNMMLPYLKNAFNQSTFIWDDWSYKFNLDIIRQEQPDVVVYLILESLIPNIVEKGLTAHE